MKKNDIKKTVLKNGLVLITAQVESDIFSISAGIKAGSLYENNVNNGVSHMVEHMLFKGTSNRSIDKLNDDIERLAGEFDIYTSYNQTVLNANTMKYKADECIEIISDMLRNSIIPEKDLRMEKKVIAEEIKMEKDDPEDNAYIGLYKTVFPDSWQKFDITGSIKSVKSLDVDTVRQYYKSYYTPANTVLVMLSSYSHDEMTRMALKHFGSWTGKAPENEITRPCGIFGGRHLTHRKTLGQAHLLYGFDINGLSRKEEISLALLNKKIGSSSNSVLFRELRDKRGYAYNVYSDLDLVDGIKMFYIYAAVSKENIKNTEAVINNAVHGFASGDYIPDSNGISLIKDIFATDTTIATESHGHMADYLLDGELGYNNPMEYENMIYIMESLDADDLKNVASKVLRNPAVYILSPYK